jgi:hypothetical protein
MGVETLRFLGHRTYRATRAARTFQRHDDRALEELAQARKDRIRYITMAREKIAELERILLSDLREKELERDAGWDIESLREEVRSSAQWGREAPNSH